MSKQYAVGTVTALRDGTLRPIVTKGCPAR
jgi:hypothetical protein